MGEGVGGVNNNELVEAGLKGDPSLTVIIWESDPLHISYLHRIHLFHSGVLQEFQITADFDKYRD